MNFLVAQQELASRVRAYDLSVSADETDIQRWLNMAQQFICSKRLWPFMLAAEIVQTVIDYTTGTISISAGATTGTLSATPSASLGSFANRYIQVSTSNDWYKITAHTAGATSITFTPAFVGTSALSAGTFKIRKLHYTTSTPLIQILDMKQLVSPFRIISQSPRDTDYFLPLYYDDGEVVSYVMSTPDSSGNLQFSFIYSPSSAINIMVRGIKALSNLSADGDEFLIPVPWQDAIINIAAYYAFQGIDDNRAVTELQIGEKRIADMAAIYQHDQGRHRVMRPVDSELWDVIQYALPSNYGPWVS